MRCPGPGLREMKLMGGSLWRRFMGRATPCFLEGDSFSVAFGRMKGGRSVSDDLAYGCEKPLPHAHGGFLDVF